MSIFFNIIFLAPPSSLSLSHLVNCRSSLASEASILIPCGAGCTINKTGGKLNIVHRHAYANERASEL